MNAPMPHPPLVPTSGSGDWMHDRLTEARGVLADTTQHPDSLVILAARVVVGSLAPSGCDVEANAPIGHAKSMANRIAWIGCDCVATRFLCAGSTQHAIGVTAALPCPASQYNREGESQK